MPSMVTHCLFTHHRPCNTNSWCKYVAQAVLATAYRHTHHSRILGANSTNTPASAAQGVSRFGWERTGMLQHKQPREQPSSTPYFPTVAPTLEMHACRCARDTLSCSPLRLLSASAQVFYPLHPRPQVQCRSVPGLRVCQQQRGEGWG